MVLTDVNTEPLAIGDPVVFHGEVVGQSDRVLLIRTAAGITVPVPSSLVSTLVEKIQGTSLADWLATASDFIDYGLITGGVDEGLDYGAIT